MHASYVTLVSKNQEGGNDGLHSRSQLTHAARTRKRQIQQVLLEDVVLVEGARKRAVSRSCTAQRGDTVLTVVRGDLDRARLRIVGCWCRLWPSRQGLTRHANMTVWSARVSFVRPQFGRRSSHLNHQRFNQTRQIPPAGERQGVCLTRNRICYLNSG